MRFFNFAMFVAFAVALLAAQPQQVAQAQVRGAWDQIYLQNQCYRRIQAAIVVEEVGRGWQTKGWYVLEPGETAYVADTRNSTYYVYAESIGPKTSRLHWWAEDYWTPIRGSNEQYGFIQDAIRSDRWGAWTHNFTCD